ncbi:MAG: hypothetical protein NZ534_13445, partial [Bacteroidia bacterium]|nr:hypothetical protein [Bacteroidia bacterium]
MHKSKGLEFDVVFVPFVGWDYYWKSATAPTVWVEAQAGLQELGIEAEPEWIWPVKLTQAVENTPFAERYRQERFGYLTEAMNLLYVALTRARDELHICVQNKGVGRWFHSVPESLGMVRTEDGAYEYKLPGAETPKSADDKRQPAFGINYPRRTIPVRVRASVGPGLAGQVEALGAA